MALPILEKTWQYNVNQVSVTSGVAATDHINMWFLIKQTLTGFASNPWTVARSSNSVTVANSDLWLTSANVVPGNGNRSWIVFQQSAMGTGPYQILIELYNNNGIGYGNVYQSHGVGFTGGTISSRPTASDEVVITGNNAIISPNSARNLIVSCMMSSSGDSTRLLVFGSGTCQLMYLFETVSDSLLTYKGLSYCTTGSNVPTAASHVSSSSYPWAGKRTNNYLAMLGTEVYNSSTTVVAANGGAISDITGAHAIAPLSAHSESVGSKGRIGRIADMWLGSASIPTGSTYPVSPDDKEFLQVNQFIFPWNGTVPVLT